MSPQFLNQRKFLMIDIKNNIIKIKESILNLELKLNRKKNSVNLMAVSKMQDAEKIREAFNSGQKDFGENYLQESLSKISELRNLGIDIIAREASAATATGSSKTSAVEQKELINKVFKK